ncbi:hypothetical protein H2200_005036 [Cladophialophora chaetospira]|uniref:Uncharacterized protein n=1 Tax=Cladophialophora chaetospira TaxID=386627 RepID=A0AA39CIL3_9EURO|nr:hypothetical protein H2200_005036 [Cladophialophora chaetospira]
MSPKNTVPNHPRPAPLQARPKVPALVNKRKLSLITTFKKAQIGTNKAGVSALVDATDDSEVTEQKVREEAEKKAERPTSSRSFQLLTPESTKSYLLTPDSALCSTPQDWRENLSLEEPLRLTFGIEFEHLFAYDSAASEDFKWMLEADTSTAATERVEALFGGEKDFKYCKGYKTKFKTKFMQQEILKRAGLECTINDSSSTNSWDLAHDGSVFEPEWSPSRLLPGKNIREDKSADWVVNGHELVSRVLTAPATLTSFQAFQSSDAMQEVKRYLEVLHGSPSDPYGVYVNETCGLYIHVARTPENGSIRLAKAQRKIFARKMTPQRLAKLMGTEIEGWWNPWEVILEATKEPDDYYTAAKTRYKFVNFDRIQDNDCDTGAKTIEFRQHKGTVDFTEIAHWTFLVLSLVKLAERLASKETFSWSWGTVLGYWNSIMSFPERQACKYDARRGTLRDQLEEFFKLLQLGSEPRDYWMAKFLEYNSEETLHISKDLNGTETIIIPEDLCSSCALGKKHNDRFKTEIQRRRDRVWDLKTGAAHNPKKYKPHPRAASSTSDAQNLDLETGGK